MTNSNANNKRIAKNTLMLYLRMLLTMFVGLYTTRVVLQVLGVEDYGIYNVVGGIVSLVSFLTTALNNATMRFLSYEMGNGDFARLRDAFAASLNIHIGLAAIVLIIGGILGYAYIVSALVLPQNRLTAALIVYVFSLLFGCISITQTPYTALLMSHESMSVYAYISIIEAVLKLVIVYLLLLFDSVDHLILYSIMVFVVQLLIAMLYRCYCTRKYKEARFRMFYSSETYKPILSFAGCDVYGNLCAIGWFQGLTLVINIFFGPAVNAAYALYIQVSSVINKFADNFLTAVKPQIIKQYAEGDYSYMSRLICESSKLSYLLMLLIGLPFAIECHYVLSLWLSDIPPFSVEFMQLGVLYLMVIAFIVPINTGIHATGKIKEISFVTGTIYIIGIPVLIFLYNMGAKPLAAVVCSIVIQTLATIVNLFILKHHVPKFSVSIYAKSVFLPCGIITMVATPLAYFASTLMEEGSIRLIVITLFTTLLIALLSYKIAFTTEIREKFKNKIRKHLWKNH